MNIKIWQKSLFTLITGLSVLINTNQVQSQIIPDNTLGNENSKFTPNQVKDLIEGGAIRGNNLFHSFSEFNINNNQQVYFTNPSGINNILTRVTGNNISNIFGTLGVNGNANLFFINPNGIIFGQNAKLDIKGSFFASTANAIKFADNTVFSAKDTSTNRLLTMSVPTGVQFGNNPTGDITNNGNLTVGKDLTLSGKNINITESILQTGGNLTLEGQEKVTINDSINKPVIVKSAGNMTIQGNQSVEINTLNNNYSNITSDRDIIFRSPVRLLSNGRYTTGGYFVTEDLNQNIIDFLIPHNNIIKVNGDIALGDYTGSSLYILASGNVTLGNVLITGGEPGFTFKFIPDGQGGNQFVFVVAKSDVGTLDVRSGIDEQKLPEISENNFGLPSNAGIKIGAITNSGGNVLLTNQFKPNTNLISQPANITVENINTSTFDGRNGGAIALSTNNGNITTQNLLSYSLGYNTSNGGAIALTTNNGNISTQQMFSFSYSIVGNGGKGGEIILTTNKGNISTKFLNSYLFSNNGGWAGAITIKGDNITVDGLNSSSNNGNGGDININAIGKIEIVSIYSEANGTGNGGNITLTTDKGNIMAQDINSYGNSTSGDSGSGGAIAITTNMGNITTPFINSRSYSDVGNSKIGGAITLITNKGDINAQYLETSSFSNGGNSDSGGAIALITNNGNIISNNNSVKNFNSYTVSTLGKSGSGGAIKIIADGTIIAPSLDSSSFSRLGSGNGGDIFLNTSNNISTESVKSSSSSVLGNSGSGGNITFNTDNGNITTRDLYSLSSSDLGNGGKAGNINLKISNGNISIPYIDLSATGEGGNGGIINIRADKLNLNGISLKNDGLKGSNGGQINLNAPVIELSNSDISSSSYGGGKSGEINLTATGNINLNNSRLFTTLEPNSTGNGGNINITSQNLNLNNFSLIDTGTYSIGNAGNINIKSENISLKDGSSLRSLTTDIGNAGNIFLNVQNGNISLTNSSSISTSATKTASGNSGNILINTQNLSLLNGSQIQALTEGIGTSKAGEILVNASESIIIGGVDPNFISPNIKALPAQNIVKSNHFEGFFYDNSTQQSFYYNNNQIQNIGSNNSIQTAQELQQSEFFINNSNYGNSNVEYSTRVPYTSIHAVGNDKIHVYKLNVNTGTKAVFDIDKTGLAQDIINQSLISAINTKLTLLDSQGNILASNDDASHALGGQGSPTVMKLQQDSYLRYTFTQGGIYYIQVSNFDGKGVPSGYDITSQPYSYDLQISLESNPISANINRKGQPSGIFAYTTGAGKAGNINLNTPVLTLENNGLISATTSGGLGGSININSNKLNVNSGGQLLTTTSGNNDAGDINIQVKESINLNGKETGFFANTAKNSTGNGGNIKIDPISMIIENEAAIAVNSDGSGVGGNIFLQSGSLVLNNGFINAQTANSNGGGITLEIGNYLLLANNSKITSTAGTLQSGGNGGNVQINAPFIIGFSSNPKHQIIANAFSGKGGNILINTNGIFGTEYINIQASSQSGPQGIVEINTPGIDPASGLTQLPSIPIDLSALVKNSCQVAKINSFTVTGKGGIPSSPNDILADNITIGDWGNSANISQKSALISENTLDKEKYNQKEAQGFIKDDKGNIILTLKPLQVTVNGVYLHHLDCQKLQQLITK